MSQKDLSRHAFVSMSVCKCVSYSPLQSHAWRRKRILKDWHAPWMRFKERTKDTSRVVGVGKWVGCSPAYSWTRFEYSWLLFCICFVHSPACHLWRLERKYVAAVWDIQPTHAQFYLHSLIFLNRWECTLCVCLHMHMLCLLDFFFLQFRFYGEEMSTFKDCIRLIFATPAALCIYSTHAPSVVIVVWHSVW